jgi:cation:H+ antiporter
VTVAAGYRLTLYADQLADAFNLTRSWMGLLVVGLVTSLPELATTLSSVLQVNSPDLALGNVFGSVLFNLLIVAVCDIIFRKGGLFRLMSHGHVFTAAGGMLLIAVMLMGLIFPVPQVGLFGHVGAGCLTVLVLGTGVFLLTYRYEQQHLPEAVDGPAPASNLSERRILITRFAAASAVVVLCGLGLAVTGDKLAVQSGLSRTFIGTLFLAIATSLPELIVSISALRMKAYDLMLGNILGSNIWNVLIMALADIFFWKAPFTVRGPAATLGWGQVYTGLIGIMATVVAVMALLYKGKQRRMPPVGHASMILVLLYVLCLAGLYAGV